MKGNANHGRKEEGTSGVKKLEEGHQCLDFSLSSSHGLYSLSIGLFYLNFWY